MTYLEVPSGIVVQAGETVSVLAVLEDTVLVWPAPVPAVIVTRCPAHWLVVHDLVRSWIVLLVCVMASWDEASLGAVVQAAEPGSGLAGLGATFLASPAPVPPPIVPGATA